MKILSIAIAGLVFLGLSNSASAQERRNIFAEPQNLQVLPKDIAPGELSQIMRGFTSALGRRCSHCHMGEEDQSIFTYDFASDERPLKRVAREMLKMVMGINETVTSIDRGPDHEFVTVTCLTCHRGAQKPVMIETLLDEEMASGGGEAAVARYRALREAFYGGFAYDFSAATLARYADNVAAAGNGEAAIALHLMNVEFNPASPRAYQSMGTSYERLGMLEEAIAAYKKLLALSPEFAGQLVPYIAGLEEKLANQNKE